MRSRIADKWMVDDQKIVTRHILLDGGFAELTQGAAAPLNLNLRMLLRILDGAGEQRGIAARMVPRQSFQRDRFGVGQDSLLETLFRSTFLCHKNMFAIEDDLIPLV